MLPIKERAVKTILQIELSRGELPTNVTALALNLSKYERIKTAEIVSKILMLAEDKKIKDPYILEQMK